MFGKFMNRMSGPQMIAFGFFIIISIGTLLLMLPISSRTGEWTPFLTALFTATSSSCVTGLILVDTFTQWSLFGQWIILALIQIGGLGFITLGITVSLLLRKKIGLKQRGLIKESLNTMEIGGVVRLTRKILGGTLLFELTGAFILALRFHKTMDWLQAAYYGIFHSVSAFCNAGFDLMGRFSTSSFTAYYDDPAVVLTLSFLIIIGGIGFFVWSDVWEHKFHIRQYTLHTKMVLCATLFLTFAGAALFYLLEHDHLFADMSTKGQLLSSLFCSVTPRTAGFNTIDSGALTESSKLLTIILMFIGGAPGSTAGGVKVTTVFVLCLYIRSTLTRTSGTNIFGRRLEDSILTKAAVVFSLNLILALCATMAITSISGYPVIDVAFEVFSAISTVGMTTGITGSLSVIPQLILILLMYLGRLGSLSFALSFTDKKKIAHIKQPMEKINVG